MKHISTIIISSLIPFIAAAAPWRTTLHEGWEFSEARRSHWYSATVPGVIHTDLMANGVIEDPYYRLNERGVQWIDKEDWIYRTQFDIDDAALERERIRIDFHGLDTYADVYLNGEKIIEADNMFRLWSAEIKPLLKERGNELKVYFHSPVKKALPLHDASPCKYEAWNDQSANGGLFDKQLSPYTRKAGYHYGWDWGPRLVTSGIWRKVELEAWDDARIENVQIISSDVSTRRATVTVYAEVEATRDIASATVSVTDASSGRRYGSSRCDLHAGMNRIRVDFTIDNPRLWWCNGLGKAELYDFTTSVAAKGRTFDTRCERTGIRSIEVRKRRDDNGRELQFVLNGVPVFCKGADYIPCDCFLPRIDDETYRRTVKDAADVNMNMLRVWGGGIYEDERFYDACDSLGIMIWQDFMFACALYPAEGDLLDNIREEAVCNVRRLRNHPCVVYWCGNNESQDSWLGGWRYKMERETPEHVSTVWSQYERLFYDTLAEVVAEHASGAGYQPSSPFSDYGATSNDREGDRHYWEVWHGKRPITEYNNAKSRFFSEYGFQSFPCEESVARFTEPCDRDIYSEVMMAHQRGGEHANNLIETYLSNEYRRPKDFRSLLYASQILQADAIRTAIVAHRRDKGYCQGTLYWQLNDCWAAASWSSRDWYGTWKALHYFVRGAYDMILPAPLERNGELEIHVVSDLLHDAAAKVSVRTVRLTGGEVYSLSREALLPQNASTLLFSIPVEDLFGGTAREDAVITVEVATEGREYRCIYFPCRQNAMRYPRCTLTLAAQPSGDGYDVTVQSDMFARGVYLTAGGVHFDDNFFDLLPDESRTVHAASTLPPDEFTRSLQAMSLVDTY